MLKVANIVFNSFVNDSRVLKESLSLAKDGYKVTVVAHGERDLAKFEKRESFAIKRFVSLDRKVIKSNLKKLQIYLIWCKEVVNYCKDFDILHCNDLNTLPIAVVIKRFFNRNVKIVYDAHEYETETYALNGTKKKIAKWVERTLIGYADRVITVSESIAKAYAELYGIEKPALVLNTPPLKRVSKRDIFREKFGIDKEQKIYLYQGALTPNRGIELLLETFAQIEGEGRRKKGEGCGALLPCIVFMGYGALEESIKSYCQKYKNIFLHEAVAPEVILEYTSSADFGISMIEDSCLSYRYCLPNKMFEYMMANLPVIVSNLPEMKAIVQKYEVGVVAKEQSVEALKIAIEESLKFDINELAQNLESVRKIYNWQEQERVLLQVYEGLS